MDKWLRILEGAIIAILLVSLSYIAYVAHERQVLAYL